jgi:hypothetical protein
MQFTARVTDKKVRKSKPPQTPVAAGKTSGDRAQAGVKPQEKTKRRKDRSHEYSCSIVKPKSGAAKPSE